MPVVAAVADLFTPDLFFFLHLLQIGFFLFLLRNLDLYEREPVHGIVLMFVWGALGAGLLAPPLNGAVSGRLSPEVDLVFGAALSAPIMEEFAKGLALVAAFLLGRWASRRLGTTGFDGVTDGMIYGAAVGLGFAFTENIFFYLNFAAASGFDVGLDVFLLRVDFLGVQSLLHPVFTGMFGAGIGLASASRGWAPKMLYPVVGFLVAVLLHAAWNGLPQLLLVREFGFDTVVRWFSGAEVPSALGAALEAAEDRALGISRWVFRLSLALAAGGFALWLHHERQIIRYELADEVRLGLLSQAEWELLPRFWQRFRWYAGLLAAGQGRQAREVRTLHDELVHLALLKWRVRRRGGDSEVVTRLRKQIAARRQFVVDLATDSPSTAGRTVDKRGDNG
jgi:protease PrsW